MTFPLLSFARTGAFLLVLATGAGAQGVIFFSNTVTEAPPPAGYVAAPVLDDNSPSAFRAESALRPGPQPYAVQVKTDLSNPDALRVFNDFQIGYVFAAFNIDASYLRAKALADTLLRSTKSSGAFVGAFNVYPNAGSDPTRPTPTTPVTRPSYTAARGQIGQLVGRQFAAPMLFPGSADFRDLAQKNSVAPTLRSSLFILPIQRLTLAALGLRGKTAPPEGPAAYALPAAPSDPSQRLIPWVTRFNNFGNTALGAPGAFVQTHATPAYAQLPSRGDFQAQVLHYRLRGADSVVVFGSPEGSVEGYTQEMERLDAQTGWNASPEASAIIGRQRYGFANMSNVIGDTGADSGDTAPRNTELAGVVWSGVYDLPGSTSGTDGNRQLTILISNMTQYTKLIDLPNSIATFPVFHPPGTGEDDPDNFAVGAGMHRLVNFSLKISSRKVIEWTITTGSFIGADNDRTGKGLGSPFPAKPLK